MADQAEQWFLICTRKNELEQFLTVLTRINGLRAPEDIVIRLIQQQVIHTLYSLQHQLKAVKDNQENETKEFLSNQI